MIHWVFQWLLCLLYVFYPAVACVKSVQVFQNLHACHMCSVLFLPVYCLFKCFRSSHACHMCLVLFLPVYSLFKCCRSSLTSFADFVSLFRHCSSDSKALIHFIAFSCRLPNSSTPCFHFLRCKGMATVTNWPLHMHCGITLWAHLSEPLIPSPYLCIQSKPLPLLLFCQCLFYLECITRLNLMCAVPCYFQVIIDKSLLLTIFLVFMSFVSLCN